VSTPDPRQAARADGERRKDAAHAALEARRAVLIRRARRALLVHLLDAGIATADDVAERIGPTGAGIAAQWRGPVPIPLARDGIIRRAGYTTSRRPTRHASVIAVWELADRAAALAWLARHPDLPDPPEPDDDGAPSPPPAGSPSPTPLAVAHRQSTLF